MEIKSVKQEIEKRNPTPKEILQKRQTLGNPFAETPEEYWAKKESEGQYALSDDNVNKEKEYQIKASDLDTNPMDIYRSFGLTDDDLNQSMFSVMGNR
jgi:hypothetical protein